MEITLTIEQFISEIREKYKSKLGIYPYVGESTDTVRYWIDDLERMGFDVSEYRDILSGMEITQHGSLALFHYADFTVIYGDWNPEDYWNAHGGIYRTCRSTVIDLYSGETVIKPFDKFFNIGELPETSIETVENLIANAKSIEISNKLDGSIFCVSNRIVSDYRGSYTQTNFCTSQSLNPDTSWHLEMGIRLYENDLCVQKLLDDMPEHTTLMFEMLTKEDAHVVYYPSEMYGLHLIGVRTPCGRLMTYSEILTLAEKYGVETTELFDRNFSDIMSSLDEKKSDEAEGFVIRIDDQFFKLKYNDYVSVHKTINRLVSASGVIEAFRDGKIDDLISKVPVTYKEKISEIVREIKICISNLNDSCEMVNQICRGIPEFKNRMIYIQKYVPKLLRGFCIETVKGNGVSMFSKRCKVTLKYIRDLNNTCEKYLAGPKWIDRLDTETKTEANDETRISEYDATYGNAVKLHSESEGELFNFGHPTSVEDNEFTT